jgi:hypothetical protein
MDAQFSIASIPPFPLQDFQDHTVCFNADTTYYLADFSLVLKGAYDQMTCNSSNPELPWIYNHPEPFSNNTNFDAPASFNSLFFNSEALRFPGDGLDFRRPAMPGPEQNVIDLTENSSPVEHRVHLDLGLSSVSTPSRANRPPRFPRDIIDLEEQEATASTAGVRAGSPEIEFVSSRALPSTTQSRSQSAGGHHGRRNAESDQHIRPPESNRNRPTGGWLDLRDQVSRVQQSVRRHPRIHPLNALIHRDIPNRTPPRNQLLDVDLDTIFVNTTQNMILPGELDFSTQGFLMGDVVRPPPPPPTYDAPSTPRKGFTRSPKEEDVLVCPNCEEELGIGGNDFKRQVWVIKSCGHVRHPVSLIHNPNANRD